MAPRRWLTGTRQAADGFIAWTLTLLELLFVSALCALGWYLLYWLGRGVLAVTGAESAIGATLYFCLMALPLVAALGMLVTALTEGPAAGATDPLPAIALLLSWCVVKPVSLPFLVGHEGVALALNTLAGLAGLRYALSPQPAAVHSGAGPDPRPAARPGTAVGPVRFQVGAATRTFADVVGMDELKQRLLATGRSIRDGAAPPRGRTPPTLPRNGILLHGLPGNGKTLFVEALAGELELPYLRATFGDLASKWVNETTENVTRLFRDAQAQAPCLLFIDEIDALLVKRDGMVNSDSEAAKTVNALLTELVDLRRFPIVLVAATNYLEQLDPAAIREGRFDFKIEVPPPDQAAREAILRATLERCGLITGVTDATLRTAAARWSGYSAARLTAVIEELASDAARPAALELADFMTALRRLQGRKGSLPEDTRSLEQMHFPPQIADQLQGIAQRMRRIEEIEGLGGTVPAGLLFFGPPGTGKTATARALAKTTGWAWLATSGHELLAAPERIDAVLKEAAELRPCIVFIDEADDVLAARDGNPYATSVTNKLLAVMDGATGKVPDVVLIAATNLPERMDAAALRGGRFSEKIEFSLPDRATREAFIADWCQATRARLGRGFTPARASVLLDGQSLANVQDILQQAVNRMIERRIGGDAGAALSLADLRDAAASITRFQ